MIGALVARKLNETATRSRAEREVPDGKGGWTTLPPTEVEVPCRIRPAEARERETVARQESMRVEYIVYLLPDADVRRGDTLAVRGMSLEVLSVRMPSEPDYKAAQAAERQS